jgi:serine/threonine-protein kinase
MNERDLFIAALNKPQAAERAAFLDAACGDNAELRVQVEALLREHAQLGSFLEAPAPPVPTADELPLREGPGKVIGPYKLLEQIGEGGFGVVFMAEQQQPLRRKVALKVLKPGMDTRQVVARFEAERQALALMDHPNIAHVLDGGETASGRPYFVMELVRGMPITAFCDQNSLPVRQRLELLVAVCQAVQHAHQKGIIHRDVKPSNVLVTLHDGTPVVKVIDFGIAKALGQQLTEKTLVTGFAQLVGTPLYMSPEQAEMSGLDIDTRTDIYSLGVLLYELLTSTTPFDQERLRQAGYDELRRIIREEEPPRPSTRLSTLGATLATVSAHRKSDPKRLGQLVRGELDWIVMKCLEKDRNRRYATANALARDLQRYLADETVEACPPSAGYRLRKFARKYGKFLATAGAFLVLLLLGGAITTWQALDLARADRDRAERQRDEAQLQAKRGQDIHETLGRAAALREQARAAAPGDATKWAEARAMARRAEALLEGGPAEPELAERVGALLAALAEEESDRRMVATLDEILLRKTATNVQQNRFAGELVLPEYAAAFRAYGLAGGETEPAEAAARLRARPEAIRDRLVAALDDWAALAERQQAKERDWLHQVVAAADPDEWRTRVRRARAGKDRAALEQLAEQVDIARQPPLTLDHLGSSLDALGAHEAAARLLRRAQQRYAGDFWINHKLGRQLLKGEDKGQLADAVRFYTAAVALRPTSPGTHYNLGLALHAQGRLDEAIVAYRQARELDPKYFAAHYNLGTALHAKGKLDEAVREFQEALRLDPKSAWTHHLLGNTLLDLHRLDEAVGEFREALRLDSTLARAHNNLGLALEEQGEVAAAIQEYRAALALDPKYARAHTNLGNALYGKRQLDAAIREYRAALALDPKYAKAHYNLGTALKAKGQLDAAIQEYRAALALDPKYANAHRSLGNALHAKGNRDEAIREYRAALALDPKDALTHYNLGNTLRANGQLDEAVRENRVAIDLEPHYAEAHCNLGGLLRQKGQYAEALASLRRGHELGSKRPGWNYASAAWVREVEQLVALEPKLAAILKGEAQPVDAAERITLAGMCYDRAWYAAAARFHSEAFAAESKLADDFDAVHHYNAARAAALAGAGKGRDEPPPDDTRKAQLRGQARDWLQADLAAYAKHLGDKDPQAATTVQLRLQYWITHPDLAGLRDQVAVAKLPAEEQEACRKLWAAVAALLQKAQEKSKP